MRISSSDFKCAIGAGCFGGSAIIYRLYCPLHTLSDYPSPAPRHTCSLGQPKPVGTVEEVGPRRLLPLQYDGLSSLPCAKNRASFLNEKERTKSIKSAWTLLRGLNPLNPNKPFYKNPGPKGTLGEIVNAIHGSLMWNRGRGRVIRNVPEGKYESRGTYLSAA